MSSIATIWAAKQKTQRPADKLVLWAMADAVREGLLCFLSVASVVEFTGLDRKTVLASQARLKADQTISDTGDRVGATRQVIVWKLSVDTVPETGRLETVPETASVPETGLFNSPVFTIEQSQKRDTEPVIEPTSEPNGSSGVCIADDTHDADDEADAPPIEPQAYLDQWNAMAARVGLPPANKLTDERRKRIKARIAEYGPDAFTEAISAVERSSFCRGASTGGWRAGIDFLLQASSFTKLLEGFYDRASTRNAGANNQGLANPMVRAVAARHARRAGAPSG